MLRIVLELTPKCLAALFNVGNSNNKLLELSKTLTLTPGHLKDIFNLVSGKIFAVDLRLTFIFFIVL
jgi:hypothetical protein